MSEWEFGDVLALRGFKNVKVLFIGRGKTEGSFLGFILEPNNGTSFSVFRQGQIEGLSREYYVLVDD